MGKGSWNDPGTNHDGIGASNEDVDRVVETIRKAGGEAVASCDSVTSEEGAKRIIQTAVDNLFGTDVDTPTSF